MSLNKFYCASCYTSEKVIRGAKFMVSGTAYCSSCVGQAVKDGISKQTVPAIVQPDRFVGKSPKPVSDVSITPPSTPRP